jgi:hypothetical protein
VQNDRAKVVAVKQAGRPECKVAAQLLVKALAEKNVPFNFVTSKYFQAYVAFVSGLTYRAPSRYNLIASLEQISEIIATKVLKTFTNAAFMGICADSWTSGGRHVTAITAGLPGTSLYLNSYDNLGADDAMTTAAALHECVLVSMQLPRDMDQSNSMYPTGKVSTFTSDTTNVMPATARLMRDYGLFEGCVWIPCFSHIANLLLLDQLRVADIAALLAASKQITTTFRVGSFRKLFITCDSATLPMFC